MQGVSCIYYNAVPSLHCINTTAPGTDRAPRTTPALDPQRGASVVPGRWQVCPLDFKQSVFPRKKRSRQLYFMPKDEPCS
jgi:hypothetical protein